MVGYGRLVFDIFRVATHLVPGTASSQLATKVIKPINMAGRSSMHILTAKKIANPANSWFALH